MNKTFIHDDFLLENKYGQELYHDYVKDLPIIDYHCHLPPEQISDAHVFENITQAWIYGDHYKWRAMRTLGIGEEFITGSASDEQKFQHWAKTVPYTLRNPLYHWTHLELARYFDIYDLLTPESAKATYSRANEVLQSTDCRQIITGMNVETVCTTDDPVSTLEHHKKLAESNYTAKVYPAFRPDKAILIQKTGFNDYINELEKISDTSIDSFEILCDVLRARMEFFHANSCRLSDHGLEYIYFTTFTENEVASAFKKRRCDESITDVQALKYQSALLQFLSSAYHDLGWVQQFHLGALRNNNDRMEALLGVDTGWDSIGDYPQAESLAQFLNAMDGRGQLTKTIIYNLNPADNEVMASMIGNYNDGSVKGKVQFGSAWWFLDQKDGMIAQINALSNMGMLSTFIGMLTDSRSFLSYPRHEYFRRVLCNLFGDEIKRGELPDDVPWVGKILSDISYHNAKDYFNF